MIESLSTQPSSETILVAEDRASMGEMLKQALEAEGYRVLLASHGAQAIKFMSENRVDLVLSDLKMPRKGGLDVLKAAVEERPVIPVILMTAFATIEIAVDAMRQGAYDFIPKPFDTSHLLMKISRALESHRLSRENMLLREESESRLGGHDIVGRSEVMRQAMDRVRKVAPTRTTVLVLGESGTGKELFARAIHHLSPRRDRAFVAINCAAIPANLLESEMFGHEKGAFTGADRRRMGRFELANGGTLFLDEISELETPLQAKLLRVLQEDTLERVGGEISIPVDVRVIAASNRNLSEDVKSGRFREDLYYRLNVLPVHVPPLRDRKEDILPLAEWFVQRVSREIGSRPKRISPEAAQVLEDYSWKGNVRELENTIERALILCDGDQVEPQHLGIGSAEPGPGLFGTVPMDGSLQATASAALRLVESERIRRALTACGGNKSRVAEVLEVSYKTLLTKIKDYGLG